MARFASDGVLKVAARISAVAVLTAPVASIVPSELKKA